LSQISPPPPFSLAKACSLSPDFTSRQTIKRLMTVSSPGFLSSAGKVYSRQLHPPMHVYSPFYRPTPCRRNAWNPTAVFSPTAFFLQVFISRPTGLNPRPSQIDWRAHTLTSPERLPLLPVTFTVLPSLGFIGTFAQTSSLWLSFLKMV